MSSASAERELAFDTYVPDEDGVVHRFEQGSVAPEWVAEQLTDSDLWATREVEAQDASDEQPAP